MALSQFLARLPIISHSVGRSIVPRSISDDGVSWNPTFRCQITLIPHPLWDNARRKFELDYVYPAIFLLATIIVYILPSGRAILDDGDALYAHIAQQMLARGDWITPHANGIRFLDKPPLMFWLMAAAFKIFGVHEWVARLPGAIGIAGTAGLLWILGRRAAGALSGLIAALSFVLATGTLFFTLEAFPDIFLIFFLTLAFYLLVTWYSGGGVSNRAVAGFGFAVGGAALAKSLIGVFLPLGVAVLFLTVVKGWRVLKPRHVVIAIFVSTAIALPWHLIVGSRNPGFYEHYFVNEQVLRFLGRRQPVDYGSIPIPIFWALILLWFFPWSAFLPGIVSLRRMTTDNRETRELVVGALCWAGLVFVFFTISSRLEHYSFPLLPPLALLVGVSIGQRNELSSRWFSRSMATLAVSVQSQFWEGW
jgi:4-amino-4-deoxy-L-arabinose transferase-like glycosyltransferase